MKNKIKEILREGTIKNSLGVAITRPNQEMILMRGIPGSGKSTEASKRVAEGVIHSTDTVIESMGNYKDFFAKMIAEKDFTPLSRAHSKNFENAKISMKEGISPVIVDNTNIKANEAKNYVKEALNMGYADENIKIVDVGTGGLDAKGLAERNTHGVPLDKIKSMMDSHAKVGKLTVEKILESKDMYKDSGILYSAVVLDNASKNALNFAYAPHIPKGWTMFTHHMTIAFGKGVDNKEDLGKTVPLTVTHIGVSDMAIAVKVSGYPSKNAIPHITLAVNPDGGKPVMSNNITKWLPIKTFIINGVVTNISKNK